MFREQNTNALQAQVLLIAACNNCPCGWFGSVRRKCKCPVPQIRSYQQRMSGPILDRIDMHINMPDVNMSNGEFLAG